MRVMLVWSMLVAIWGSVSFAGPLPGFGHPTPIPDANPEVRQEMKVQVPAKLEIVRTGESLSVSVDPHSLETVKIEAGSKMVLGVEARQWVYPVGNSRPAGGGRILSSGLTLVGSTSIHSMALEGIPKPGIKYVVEMELSIFETDIPPQHLWTPQSPKYKVLLTRVLKQIVD